MQHITGLALVVAHQLLIQMVFLPILEQFGLLFRQPGTHFKFGAGQVDGFVKILCQWSYTPNL